MLPNEVLREIFVHLTYQDRGRVNLVCRRWREVVKILDIYPRSVIFSPNFDVPLLCQIPRRMEHPFILHKELNGRPTFKNADTETGEGACLSWTGRCWEVKGGGAVWGGGGGVWLLHTWLRNSKDMPLPPKTGWQYMSQRWKWTDQPRLRLTLTKL